MPAVLPWDLSSFPASTEPMHRYTCRQSTDTHKIKIKIFLKKYSKIYKIFRIEIFDNIGGKYTV